MYGRGISLWKLWKTGREPAFLAGYGHVADRAESHAPLAAQLLARDAVEELERFRERVAQQLRRRVTVDVPDVTGLVVDDASAQLKALGLKVDVDDQDSLLERLLPGPPKVCATDPDRGATVDPGTTVRLLVSKQC